MVHNHQTTLGKHGYDVKVGDKYQLGLKLLEVGVHIRKSIELYEIAEPENKSLIDETGGLPNLLVKVFNPMPTVVSIHGRHPESVPRRPACMRAISR